MQRHEHAHCYHTILRLLDDTRKAISMTPMVAASASHVRRIFSTLQQLHGVTLNAATSVENVTAKTADLCDQHPDKVQLLTSGPNWKRYGQQAMFAGPAVTLKVYEDNTLVREMLEKHGLGRVLVIDGGASFRCALVGDQLAQLAVKNKWAGIVVYGPIRDSDVINSMPVGIVALGTCPVKSVKRKTTQGMADIPIQFGSGPVIRPGYFIYADYDGVLISEKQL